MLLPYKKIHFVHIANESKIPLLKIHFVHIANESKIPLLKIKKASIFADFS